MNFADWPQKSIRRAVAEMHKAVIEALGRASDPAGLCKASAWVAFVLVVAVGQIAEREAVVHGVRETGRWPDGVEGLAAFDSWLDQFVVKEQAANLLRVRGILILGNCSNSGLQVVGDFLPFRPV